MKKILIFILIILLGLLCYNIVTTGQEIAGVKILSIKEMQNANEELDTTIAQVEELKEVNYPAKISELNTTAEAMLKKKNEYEELQKYSSEQDVANAKQTEKYDMEVLWVRIGNHAEKCGVVPKLEILSSSDNTIGANDIRITATGSYIGISDFVRAIEDDSKMGFSIDSFELVPVTAGNGSELQATFKIKDVFLNYSTTTITSNNNSSNNIDTNENKTTNEVNTNTIQ